MEQITLFKHLGFQTNLLDHNKTFETVKQGRSATVTTTSYTTLVLSPAYLILVCLAGLWGAVDLSPVGLPLRPRIGWGTWSCDWITNADWLSSLEREELLRRSRVVFMDWFLRTGFLSWNCNRDIKLIEPAGVYRKKTFAEEFRLHPSWLFWVQTLPST